MFGLLAKGGLFGTRHAFRLAKGGVVRFRFSFARLHGLQMRIVVAILLLPLTFHKVVCVFGAIDFRIAVTRLHLR